MFIYICVWLILLVVLQVSSISAGPSQEVFSFSFGGSTGDLLSAGCNSQVSSSVQGHFCVRNMLFSWSFLKPKPVLFSIVRTKGAMALVFR